MSLIHILVIEDDLAIRLGVCDALEFGGYSVTGVDSGEAGLAELRSSAYDLVLLDLVLPGQDGLQIIRAIREAKPYQAVIMLTARGDVQDRIRGLALGADDYVVKPFDVGELLARVEAVLRRVAIASAPCLDCVLPSGAKVDFLDRSVRLSDGRCVQLSEKENDILRYLFARRGQIIGRNELIERIWGINPKGLRTRTVDMHIARLREKIGDTDKVPQWIATIRGRGYRFVVEGSQ